MEQRKTQKVPVTIECAIEAGTIDQLFLIFSGDHGNSWYEVPMEQHQNKWIVALPNIQVGNKIIYAFKALSQENGEFIEDNNGEYFEQTALAPKPNPSTMDLQKPAYSPRKPTISTTQNKPTEIVSEPLKPHLDAPKIELEGLLKEEPKKILETPEIAKKEPLATFDKFPTPLKEIAPKQEISQKQEITPKPDVQENQREANKRPKPISEKNSSEETEVVKFNSSNPSNSSSSNLPPEFDLDLQSNPFFSTNLPKASPFKSPYKDESTNDSINESDQTRVIPLKLTPEQTKRIESAILEEKKSDLPPSSIPFLSRQKPPEISTTTEPPPKKELVENIKLDKIRPIIPYNPFDIDYGEIGKPKSGIQSFSKIIGARLTEEPQKKQSFISRPELTNRKHCSQCKANLKNRWKICPICGTKV